MPTHKEQQRLDKVCKVTWQNKSDTMILILFFDFQYEKNYFQLSALPLFTLLCGPWRKAVPAQWLNSFKFVLVIRQRFHGSLIHGKFDLKTTQSLKTPSQECGEVPRSKWWAPIWTQESPTSMQIDRPGESIPENNCWVVTDVSTSWAEVIFKVNLGLLSPGWSNSIEENNAIFSHTVTFRDDSWDLRFPMAPIRVHGTGGCISNSVQ